MTTTTSEQRTAFEGWAILELMGHRRLGGYVQEQELAGHGFLRIDVPGDDNGHSPSSQFYSPGSVYCLTPTTEDVARRVADVSRPAPVHVWELPSARGGTVDRREVGGDDGDFENEGDL